MSATALTARQRMRHSTIARAWLERGERCPFDAFVIDPGEPCCFGCGWRSPTQSAADITGPWWKVWDLVGGLLEKAHLVNHVAAPELGEDPLNYALLCMHCHKGMTASGIYDVEDYDAALAWVVARPSCNAFFNLATDDLRPKVAEGTAGWALPLYRERRRFDAEVRLEMGKEDVA